MNTDELLLASHVRTLAVELRSSARATYYAGIFDVFDDADRKRRLSAWDGDHPMEAFIDIALTEIQQVATYIDSLARAYPMATA